MVENKKLASPNSGSILAGAGGSTMTTTSTLESKDVMEMPHNCLPLMHQVAGHFHGRGRTKLGLLQTNDGLILKPVQSPPNGQREHEFYKRLFQRDESELNQDELELKRLTPTYRGALIHNNIVYIKMDDIAYGFKNPSVADFKLGRITHDPFASPEKQHRHRSRYPPAEKLGFQLIGMRVFNKKENSFSHYDKVFGRRLTEENLIHGLALFYQFHQCPQLRAVRETIRLFDEIRCWFERQRTYHFYASSLIVIYEALFEDTFAKLQEISNEEDEEEDNSSADNSLLNDDHKPDLNNNSIDLNKQLKVFMADFAHVFPAVDHTKDQNNLFGLEKLIEYLNRLLDPEYKFKDLRKS